jgi:hypothetical protein
MIRLSVKGLAKYMTSGAAAQRKVLRDFKYPREDEPMAMRLYYEDACDCIETFLRGGYDRQWLRAEGDTLAIRAAGVGGRQRARLHHNARAVRQYEQYFGGRRLQLQASLNLAIEFSGVQIKVVPDLNVIEGTKAKIIKLEFSLTPPSDELIAIVVQTMFEAATGQVSDLSPSSVLLFDVPRGAERRGARMRSRTLREIEAACQTIATIWDTIEPPRPGGVGRRVR